MLTGSWNIPMAFKIENSRVSGKIWNHLKINIQAHIDPRNGPCKLELNRTSSSQVLSI